MKDDILTVIWKERRAMFRARGRRSQTLLTMLSPIFLAIYMPWSIGPDWLDHSFSLMLSIIVTFILVGITIPDSFAGERERHTLPTLLASRLPDRAIFIGKIASSVALGWVAAMLVLLVSLVTVNVLHWPGHVLLYSPSVLLADAAVSLLVALFTASLGAVFSMRSSTVQQAQQATMSVMLLPAMVLQFGLMFVLKSESAKATLESTLGSLSFAQLISIIVGVLAVLVVALFSLALRRFRRAQLILA